MRPHECYPDYNFYNISPYKLVQLPEPLLQELDALAALRLQLLAQFLKFHPVNLQSDVIISIS